MIFHINKYHSVQYMGKQAPEHNITNLNTFLRNEIFQFTENKNHVYLDVKRVLMQGLGNERVSINGIINPYHWHKAVWILWRDK